MATEWMPLTRFEPKQWLLGTGEIIKEPALEQTSTGRKVRAVGSKKSFFHTNLDKALWEAAELVAKEKGTTLVSEVLSPQEQENLISQTMGFRPSENLSAKLHAVHNSGVSGAGTTAWWKFKSSKLPIEAVLSVMVMNAPISYQPGRQHVLVRLTFPTIDRRYNVGEVKRVAHSNHMYTEMTDVLPDDLMVDWREFLRDNRPDWDDTRLTGGLQVPTAQKGVELLLDLVQHFDKFDSIQIPNILDIENPSWMDLELYETNVNAEFVSDLTEWLDSNPLIDNVLNAYQNLLQQLSASGFTVNEKAGNDFMSALLSGNTATMNMQVMNVIGARGGGSVVDHTHKVSIHLPSGSIVVQCDHENMDLEGISEGWDQAMTIARLSGEEDVLVAYARKIASDKAAKAAKQFIKSRQ